MKAVILAGGFGKRLKPLTDDRPKPMIQVGANSIMEWQLSWLHSYGIDQIIICTGYLKEVIINKIGSGRKFGVSVGYSVEESPLGTGGAIKNAQSLVQNEGKFLVLNGDILTNFSPLELARNVDGEKICGSIAAVPLRSSYGIVQVSGSLAKGFEEKPILKDFWINAGVYCLSTKIFDILPENGNLEQTTLPFLASQNRLEVKKFENAYWRSIDSHKDVEEAEKEIGLLSLANGQVVDPVTYQ